MSRNLVVTLVVIVVIILAGWWFLTKSQQPTTPTPASEVTQTPSPEESSSSTATEGAMMKEGETKVAISSTGFSPQNITIKVGETVAWMNNDTVDHTVNSAVHPTHLVYPPLNLGVIKPGEKKSLTFPTAGTYKYHDHLNPSLFGSVTVQ